MQSPHLAAEQSPARLIELASTPAGIKTILFHVHGDEALENRLQAALSMARAFGAHLHLLHVTPIEAYTVTDAFATFVSSEILGVLEDEAEKMRKRIESHLANEDVSWDYEELTGEMMPRLVQRAALSDLVIAGRQPTGREFGGPSISFLGDLIQAIRTPLMVVGDESARIDPFGGAVVAWNGSYEAANALRAAVPLLQVASQVRLVTVEEEKEEQFPSIAALEFLSRHGVHAELSALGRYTDTVEQQIVDQAAIDGASYIVIGGYGHSRAGEFLFGGVTRTLLKSCPLPIVVSH